MDRNAESEIAIGRLRKATSRRTLAIAPGQPNDRAEYERWVRSLSSFLNESFSWTENDIVREIQANWHAGRQSSCLFHTAASANQSAIGWVSKWFN